MQITENKMAEIARLLSRDPEAEIKRLREALAALVNRLDEIHADPAYKSVWTSYYVHGGRYDGPTYVDALARARAALTEATTPVEASTRPSTARSPSTRSSEA